MKFNGGNGHGGEAMTSEESWNGNWLWWVPVTTRQCQWPAVSSEESGRARESETVTDQMKYKCGCGASFWLGLVLGLGLGLGLPLTQKTTNLGLLFGWGIQEIGKYSEITQMHKRCVAWCVYLTLIFIFSNNTTPKINFHIVLLINIHPVA